ncbi:unnamed protein product [Oreochromis niloticus]|nr:unnamed protein product [Mustela putorius furo]
MEEYEEFVQHLLPQLRRREEKEEENHRPSSASSVIRFYGRSILPPLLSEKQREEMRRLRDEAAVHTKFRDDPRMAYIQTILHSVQLRKTPTLEELLQESEIITQSSYFRKTTSGLVCQDDFFVGSSDNVSLPAAAKGKVSVCSPPLTSTTYSAFFASNVTPQENYQEGRLTDQVNSQQGSQPNFLHSASCQSFSSGYVTNENVENCTAISERINAENESNGFDCSEGFYNTVGFFLHNTSNTIAKMPDIISHPPIDGEELERSGRESSFCDNLTDLREVCCTSFEEDSLLCDPLPTEKSKNGQRDSVMSDDNNPFSSVHDPDKDAHLDKNVESVAFLEKSSFSDNPTHTQSTRHRLTAELCVQRNPRETELEDNQVDEADSKLSEEPYRLSLQALLKKSQEYRRRQRMLRNQAKNTKIQERTQEQPRAKAEEQSSSDKENDEIPYKDTVTAEGKKTKDKRSTFISSVETSLKKSCENERMIGSELSGKKMTHLTGDGDNKEMTSVDEETIIISNRLNSSQVLIKPKQFSAFIQQQPLETSLVKDPPAFFKGPGKYRTVPAPNFCRSPVHYKRKSGQQVDAEETSKGKLEIGTGLKDHHNSEEVNPGHQNSHIVGPPTVNLAVEGEVTSVLTKSPQHIDQLESDLSSLKVLITDLESTVKENLKEDSHSQAESSPQSELSFKGMTNEQIKSDYWEDRQRAHGDNSSDAEYRKWSSRQLSNNYRNMHEDSVPEATVSDTDDVPLTVKENRDELRDFSERRLIKTLSAERESRKKVSKEALTGSSAQPGDCRKQQPPAKCIFSVDQQMRIPDVFRNVPSDPPFRSYISVPSDNSNHLFERMKELALEGHDSTRSPSLNQSYDVDTPSGLWFTEGSGSKGHPEQEKHLTPQNGSDSQGGASKVKRRLLMHTMEETQEGSANISGGADSIRPNSSTPRAAGQWCEGLGSQKDKREELKEIHAAQVRALQEEHRRQQEELLQALAVRYRLLQSVSFPCSVSGSRLGDTLTFSTLSQDTQQFLQALRQQSTQLCNKQDLLLQERVTLQLRAARYEVYDIFFNLSARERMQLISWDRELAKERELRRQGSQTGRPRGKSFLSAATQKSLERKRGMMIQRKAAGRHRGVMTRTAQKSGFSAELLPETKRGHFRANPQRVPKSASSSRPQ